LRQRQKGPSISNRVHETNIQHLIKLRREDDVARDEKRGGEYITNRMYYPLKMEDFLIWTIIFLVMAQCYGVFYDNESRRSWRFLNAAKIFSRSSITVLEKSTISSGSALY